MTLPPSVKKETSGSFPVLNLRSPRCPPSPMSPSTNVCFILQVRKCNFTSDLSSSIPGGLPYPSPDFSPFNSLLLSETGGWVEGMEKGPATVGPHIQGVSSFLGRDVFLLISLSFPNFHHCKTKGSVCRVRDRSVDFHFGRFGWTRWVCISRRKSEKVRNENY